MSFIGSKPSQTLATPTSQYFNGTGSQTVFTLNRAVNVAEDLEVFVNNIQQEPGVGKSYTAVGTTLTFDAAPSSGTANVYVVYRGLAEVTTRLEHDPNAALAATTGTFSGTVTADGLTVDGTGGQITTDNNGFITSKQSLDVSTAGGRFIGKSNRGELGQIAIEQTATGADGGYIRFSTSPSGSTSPAERMRIDSSGNVGLGTASPSAKLDIRPSNDATNTFRIYRGVDSGYQLDYLNISQYTGDSIFNSVSSGGANNEFIFQQNATERMRINGSGNVGIGSQTPSFRLAVEDGTGATRINVRNTANAAPGSGIYFEVLNGASVVGNGTIATQSNGDMAFFTGTSSGTERMRILSTGGLTFNGDTAAANALDDYEEGTFNVVLGGSSSTSGQTYTNQTGRYTKIGSLVHCSGYITLSSIGTVTGTYARLQNLPFTVGSAAPYQNGNYSAGVISYWSNFGVNSAGFTLYPDTGATFAYVMYRGSFGTSAQYMSPSGWGSAPGLMFGLTYTTDS